MTPDREAAIGLFHLEQAVLGIRDASEPKRVKEIPDDLRIEVPHDPSLATETIMFNRADMIRCILSRLVAAGRVEETTKGWVLVSQSRGA